MNCKAKVARIHMLLVGWMLAQFFAGPLYLASADDPVDRPGTLVIVGGGLRSDNASVFTRLIEEAGGIERARFAILPTASLSQATARTFRERLAAFALPSDQIEILDVTLENAPQSTADPAILSQVETSTALFMTGGDQGRIARALIRADGTATPLLDAARRLWARGGVIAGSSAGAAVQCDPMLAVSGLPDEAIDEGIDALDYGLKSHSAARGLLVSRGLGFFTGGLIDQHFHQYRGRLGRLARATTELRLPRGFGIDENTALFVSADGSAEVVGAGHVTLVDATAATLQDGPLGCRLRDLRVSLLTTGDRINTQTGECTVHANKALIVAGMESHNGNFLIPDIAAREAVALAVVSGLTNNTQRKQEGISLTYAGRYGHGYRFTFRKTEATRGYHGYVGGVHSHSAIGAGLDIEPISVALTEPRLALPLDLPDDPSRPLLEAVSFRGILQPTDERRFDPEAAITRRDLALALARGVHLSPPRPAPRPLADVSESDAAFNEIQQVVTADLMNPESTGKFLPDAPIERGTAAEVFLRLAEHTGCEPSLRDLGPLADLEKLSPDQRVAVETTVRAGWLTAAEGRFQPEAFLTRQQAGIAVAQILGLVWE